MLKAIRPYSKVPVDVHLMVEPVDELVPAFAKAGADIITASSACALVAPLRCKRSTISLWL